MCLLIGVMITIIGNGSLWANEFIDVEILKEEKRSYTIDEVRTLQWLPFEKYTTSPIPKTRKTYWLRFVYQKKESEKVYYLASPYILHNSLNLYFKTGDSLHHYQSGVSLDFDQRNLFLPTLYLQLPRTNGPTTCYLHVESFDGYSFFFSVHEVSSIIHQEIQLTSTEYFLMGISFLAALFSFIYFLFLRDKLYLYYAIFSAMLVFSRLVYSGFIFNYANKFYEFDNLRSIYLLYTIGYTILSFAILLYFYEFLKFYRRSKRFYLVIYTLAAIRSLIFLYQIIFPFSDTIHLYIQISDALMQLVLLGLIVKTSDKYIKPRILAACSLSLILIGNVLLIPQIDSFIKIFVGGNWRNFDVFLKTSGIEVVVFAISMAYRSHFLKREHDLASAKVLESLRESERLKDDLNKQLEIKVEERTRLVQEQKQEIETRNAQIERMNEILKNHNIELKLEVNNANEARIFQKLMNFSDFQKIFPDDEACFKYLAQLKWKKNKPIFCKRCGNEVSPNWERLSIRCGKCKYLESVTNNTLFQKLKFPILKAFYVTYRLSTSTNESTLASLADEIELRNATLWSFKQKVLALMNANSNRKKHKDGWTHLIEFSIAKDDSKKQASKTE